MSSCSAKGTEPTPRCRPSADPGLEKRATWGTRQISSPVPRTVIDMQDFDSFGFRGIDHDVREWRQRQFFGAAPVAGPCLGSVRFSEGGYAGRLPARSVLRNAGSAVADSS